MDKNRYSKGFVIAFILFAITSVFAGVGDREFVADVNIAGDLTVVGDVDATAYTGDGSALTGITGATGGISNTGTTSIIADSDGDSSGVIALQIGSPAVTMLEVTNAGNIDITNTITSGVWNGTAIDISSYTNLVAGTNITLSGDTLNVDDAFLVNDASDTMLGTLTSNGLTITTGNALTLGIIQWDDGSDKIEGNVLADDSVDDDALDFTSITLNDFTVDIASTQLTDTADILYETELDTFSELQTQIADKTLVNEEDAATIDSAWIFSNGITGILTGNVTGDLTGNADTATILETARDFTVSGDVATASGSAFSGGGDIDLAVSFASEVIVNVDISPTAAISADKLTNGSTNAIPTLTQETNWDTHLSSDGSAHTFIDQSVISGASPVFDNANMTGNVSIWTNDLGYVTSTLSTEQVQDITGGMVSGNTETLIAVTYQDSDGTLDFVVDEAGIDHDALTNFDSSEHFLQSAITQTGIVTTGWWNASPIDISDYTNLVAGTNITLTNDTLNIDNPVVADLTGNADTATNVVDNDFGDVNVVDGAWIVETVAGAEVILGTGTTGNYVASITDGLAIDGGDGGSEGATLTIAFDPTELLGNRTWGDASTDTIVWTWDRATGTDPTMTFGNDLITLNGDLGAGAITGTSLTDGTATLSGGSLTNAVNGTFSGTVQGETLTDGYITIDAGVIDSSSDLALRGQTGQTIYIGTDVIFPLSGDTVDLGKIGQAFKELNIYDVIFKTKLENTDIIKIYNDGTNSIIDGDPGNNNDRTLVLQTHTGVVHLKMGIGSTNGAMDDLDIGSAFGIHNAFGTWIFNAGATIQGGDLKIGASAYGLVMVNNSENPRICLKYGAAGTVGGDDILALSNREANGEISIQCDDGTSGGAGETEVMRLSDTLVDIKVDTQITGNLIVGGTTADSLFEVDGAEGLAIETVTGNTTLDDTHSTLLVNASGNVTITLPTAASAYNNTDGIGRIYEIKKIDADADIVTLDGNSSELIDGATTAVITTQWEAITVQSNGTSWYII